MVHTLSLIKQVVKTTSKLTKQDPCCPCDPSILGLDGPMEVSGPNVTYVFHGSILAPSMCLLSS